MPPSRAAVMRAPDPHHVKAVLTSVLQAHFYGSTECVNTPLPAAILRFAGNLPYMTLDSGDVVT